MCVNIIRMLFLGGITLSVIGYGFTAAAIVMVGSKSCDTINVTPATIACTLPASVSILIQSMTKLQYTCRFKSINQAKY